MALISGLFALVTAAEGFSIAIVDANPGALSYEDGAMIGDLAPLYRCAIGGVDAEPEYIVLPQPRALRMLEYGEVDVVMPLAKTPKRSAYADFAMLLMHSRYVLLTLPDTDVQSIQGDRYIAANWYSAVIPLIEQAGHSPVPVDNYEVAIAMLWRGRAHGVAVPEPMTTSMTDLLDGLVSEPYVDAEAGLYVSRSAPELLEVFNVANAKCRGDF